MTVVVVGAGVIGLYAGAVLAERGHDVRILDARAHDDRAGASFVNAGLLTPSHLIPIVGPGVPRALLAAMARRSPPLRLSLPRSRSDVRWLLLALRSCTAANVEAGSPVLGRLLVDSMELLRADLRRAGEEGLLQGAGLLMLARGAGGMSHARELAEAAAANAIEVEELDSAALHRREPGVAPDVSGAVFFPGDRWLGASDLMAALISRAAAAGARIEWGQGVSALMVERARIRGVAANGAAHQADAVVLAAGAASAGLLRGIGIDLPLLAGRGYGLTLDVPTERRPRHGAALLGDYVGVAPLRDGLRVTGGMVLGARRQSVDERRVRAMTEAVRRMYPGLEPTGAAVPARAGMRPCSPDGLPYIGAVEGAEGLAVATGHGMLGVSLAAVTAARVADAVERATPPADLAAVSPARFDR